MPAKEGELMLCTRIMVSKKGWTNQNIAIDYLRKFDEQTGKKADGRT